MEYVTDHFCKVWKFELRKVELHVNVVPYLLLTAPGSARVPLRPCLTAFVSPISRQWVLSKYFWINKWMTPWNSPLESSRKPLNHSHDFTYQVSDFVKRKHKGYWYSQFDALLWPNLQGRGTDTTIYWAPTTVQGTSITSCNSDHSLERCALCPFDRWGNWGSRGLLARIA